MTLKTAEPIEMAPHVEWDVYCSPEGSAIALRPGSELVDASSNLREILEGEDDPFALLGTHLTVGGEAMIFNLDGAVDQDFVVKVPILEDEGHEYGHKQVIAQTLRMARYGGVCVEHALEGCMIDDTRLLTPRYEAVVATPYFSGVIMTHEPGITLSAAVHSRQEVTQSDALAIRRLVEQEVSDALVESGVNQDALKLIDLHGHNMLLRTSGYSQMIDLSEIVVLDVVVTLADEYGERSPKLWSREPETV